MQVPLTFYRRIWNIKAVIQPAAAVTGRPNLKKDATMATTVPAKAEVRIPWNKEWKGRSIQPRLHMVHNKGKT